MSCRQILPTYLPDIKNLAFAVVVYTQSIFMREMGLNGEALQSTAQCIISQEVPPCACIFYGLAATGSQCVR